MAKQSANAQGKIKKLEEICRELEGIAKEKVKLEREKAKGKDKNDNMLKFYGAMNKYEEIYEGFGEMEEEEKVAAKVVVDVEAVAKAVRALIGFQIKVGGKVVAEKKKREEAMEELKRAVKEIEGLRKRVEEERARVEEAEAIVKAVLEKGRRESDGRRQRPKRGRE